MTKNQVDALRNLETERHNKEMENMEKAAIPAQYISSIGSLLRGGGSLFSMFKKGKDNNLVDKVTLPKRSGGDWNIPKYTPIRWTIQ